MFGTPARSSREQLRLFQMIGRLPEMQRQLRELAAQIALLPAALPPGTAAGDDDPTGF